ncbi:MAG: hypothetical protein LBM66_06950, partial [Bifidobacteriaceae bacterium]|nr:hypothetical protein [Bifidobacteriaceae bacterium]
MYGALWRHLPGPRWFRAFTLIVVVAAIAFCLLQWVFPWVSERIPLHDVQVHGSATPTAESVISSP